MLSEGVPAPDFDLQGWRLSNAVKNGPVLLVFIKISCPTCQFTVPILQAFEGAGLQILLISQDDQAKTAQFLNRFQVTLRTVLDKAWDFTVSNAYRITHVPSQFLVEPAGTISAAVEGFDKAFIERLAERFGVRPFGPELASIPALKPG
jgi:peroxiredoxin